MIRIISVQTKANEICQGEHGDEKKTFLFTQANFSYEIKIGNMLR